MNTNQNRTMAYFDVIEACSEAGCPLCRLSQRASERYVNAVLYEMVNDPKVRADFCAARGYCNRHAWMMPEGYGRSLGIALMQKSALDTALRTLDMGDYREPGGLLRRMWPIDPDAGAPSPATRDLVAALDPQIECPACYHEAEMEHIALTTLLNHLDDADMLRGFEQSAGMCLPHFRRALALVRDERMFARLLQVQRRHLERLSDELSEFIRKNDYRYIAEGFGIEGDSWLRAIGIVSGEKAAL
jgi:hypothetical protein